jgi:transposase
VIKLERETDIEVLRQAAQLLEAENERLVKKTVALEREVLRLKGVPPGELQLRLAELERQLRQRNQELFGQSSEKRHEEGEKPSQPRAPQKGHGPREQKQLPIREDVFRLDDPDKQCPKCGGALTELKGQFEESEEITVVERRFEIRHIKRQKYRCQCGACVETALGPEKLFPGARYAIEFAVEVAVQKYLDHLPLERQVRIMGREGLVVDSQTLWDQLSAVAKHLEPAYWRQRTLMLQEPVLGADETRWPVSEQGKERKTWQVWALASPSAVHYQLHEDRSADSAKELLGDFAGALMTDDYAAYEALRKRGGKFTHANCWAHVRRKFIELESTNPAEAKAMLDFIGELYQVEKQCPTGPPGDAMRRHLRDERSRAVVAKIDEFLRTTLALPESGLARAIAYTRGCWDGLVRFLEDPRIPIDNNLTERALRGVVVGRKNHYGSRSRRGTEVAAILYSMVETAKLLSVDPKLYLKAALLAAIRGEIVPLPHEYAAALAQPQ